MASKFTKKKPTKPHPDFPLTANGNGQWSKKIRGKVYYFGTWADPNAALDQYLLVKDDLLAGRTPRRNTGDEPTVADAVNRFLSAKKALVDTAELTYRTWKDYYDVCEVVINEFGRNRLIADLGVGDFEQLRAKLADGRNPISLGNEIQRVRTLFKYAYDAELIDRPVRFGPTFKRPSKKVRRRYRNDAGPKLFAADEIRSMVDTPSPQLKAMILLAINCGFGNTDCACLPMDRLNLENGWHDFGRPKTGIERRCPLWPETIKALHQVIAHRKEPTANEDSGLVFITKYRKRWIRQPNAASDSWIDSIGLEFRKLIKTLEIQRSGTGFYSLRRTFRTVGDGAGDQPAVNFIMGHADSDADMGSVYRQEVADDRLQAVTDHVRRWLALKSKQSL